MEFQIIHIYIYVFCSSILLTAARTRAFSSQNQHLGRLVKLLTGVYHIQYNVDLTILPEGGFAEK